MSEPFSLSGILFATQQQALRDLMSDVEYDRMLAEFDPATRELVMNQAAIGWIPFSIVEALATEAALRRGKPIEAFHRELVGRTTDRTFRGVWRVLARFTTPDSIVSRVGTLWGKTYNRGHARAERGPDSIRMIVDDLGDVSEYALRGIGFSLEALIEFSGTRQSRVQWERTGNGAIYVVRVRR